MNAFVGTATGMEMRMSKTFCCLPSLQPLKTNTLFCSDNNKLDLKVAFTSTACIAQVCLCIELEPDWPISH